MNIIILTKCTKSSISCIGFISCVTGGSALKQRHSSKFKTYNIIYVALKPRDRVNGFSRVDQMLVS